MSDLTTEQPGPPTSFFGPEKIEVRDIGGSYLKVVRTKVATWTECLRIQQVGKYAVIWRVMNDGSEEIVHSDVPSNPDAPQSPPMDPALKNEIDRWQAILAGLLPPDTDPNPPSLVPGPLFQHVSPQQ